MSERGLLTLRDFVQYPVIQTDSQTFPSHNISENVNLSHHNLPSRLIPARKKTFPISCASIGERSMILFLGGLRAGGRNILGCTLFEKWLGSCQNNI